MATEGKKGKIMAWAGLLGTVVLGVVVAHYAVIGINKIIAKRKGAAVAGKTVTQ